MMIPLNFNSSEYLIRGYFFPARTDSVAATVVFLQGFPGVEGDELICGKLANAGVHVFTFNYRGTFKSGGYFSFSNVISDIGAAIKYVKQSTDFGPYQIDPANVVLGGWSFGGAMVPAGVVRNPDISRFFMISGRNFGKEARKIKSDPQYGEQVARNLDGLRSPDGPLNFRDDVIPDLIVNQDHFDYKKLAARLVGCDVLLIGGWDDDLTTIEEHTLPFYRLLRDSGAEQVRIEAVQDDHEFSKSKDQIVQLVLRWL